MTYPVGSLHRGFPPKGRARATSRIANHALKSCALQAAAEKFLVLFGSLPVQTHQHPPPSLRIM